MLKIFINISLIFYLILIKCIKIRENFNTISTLRLDIFNSDKFAEQTDQASNIGATYL